MQKRQTNQFYAKEIINRMTKQTSQMNLRINFQKRIFHPRTGHPRLIFYRGVRGV